MPCQYYGPEDAFIELRREFDTLTAMLCDLCTRVCASGRRDMIDANAALARWWTNHEEADRRRILARAAEAAALHLRETALAKLSPEERKALGL